MSRHTQEHPQKGFTLIELMIALVLGLVVIGGVISVLLSNQQTYRSNQALSQVQDGSRTAFEFLARDIRQAGGTPCGNTTRIANVLNNSPTGGGTAWWANWGNAIHGYDNATADPALSGITGNGAPVAGTNSVQLISAASSGLTITSQTVNAAQFKVNAQTPVIADDAIIVVCDPDHATVLQVNKGNANNTTVEYNSGNGSGTPGNCSKGLGFPTDCSSTNGNGYSFGENSQITQLQATDWYIGNNANGTCAATNPQACSLYRITQSNNNSPEEIVRNVTNMQLRYLQGGNFVTAGNVPDWSAVTAVQVTLTMAVPTNPNNASNPETIQRDYTTTITLRNRVG